MCWRDSFLVERLLKSNPASDQSTAWQPDSRARRGVIDALLHCSFAYALLAIGDALQLDERDASSAGKQGMPCALHSQVRPCRCSAMPANRTNIHLGFSKCRSWVFGCSQRTGCLNAQQSQMALHGLTTSFAAKLPQWTPPYAMAS